MFFGTAGLLILAAFTAGTGTVLVMAMNLIAFGLLGFVAIPSMKDTQRILDRLNNWEQNDS